MTREQFKDWLEGVGFAAIIASLVFVGIETRNSTQQAILTTQTLEITAYQELMDNISNLNTVAVEDPEVAALLLKAFAITDELTELEEFRIDRNLFQRFRHGDMAYFQFERGIIDESRLRSTLQVLRLNNPRVREFWERNEMNFVDSYRNLCKWDHERESGGVNIQAVGDSKRRRPHI